jgi:hypothetical protein
MRAKLFAQDRLSGPGCDLIIRFPDDLDRCRVMHLLAKKFNDVEIDVTLLEGQ